MANTHADLSLLRACNFFDLIVRPIKSPNIDQRPSGIALDILNLVVCDNAI